MKQRNNGVFVYPSENTPPQAYNLFHILAVGCQKPVFVGPVEPMKTFVQFATGRVQIGIQDKFLGVDAVFSGFEKFDLAHPCAVQGLGGNKKRRKIPLLAVHPTHVFPCNFLVVFHITDVVHFAVGGSVFERGKLIFVFHVLFVGIGLQIPMQLDRISCQNPRKIMRVDAEIDHIIAGADTVFIGQITVLARRKAHGYDSRTVGFPDFGNKMQGRRGEFFSGFERQIQIEHLIMFVHYHQGTAVVFFIFFEFQITDGATLGAEHHFHHFVFHRYGRLFGQCEGIGKIAGLIFQLGQGGRIGDGNRLKGG